METDGTSNVEGTPQQTLGRCGYCRDVVEVRRAIAAVPGLGDLIFCSRDHAEAAQKAATTLAQLRQQASARLESAARGINSPDDPRRLYCCGRDHNGRMCRRTFVGPGKECKARAREAGWIVWTNSTGIALCPFCRPLNAELELKATAIEPAALPLPGGAR